MCLFGDWCKLWHIHNMKNHVAIKAMCIGKMVITEHSAIQKQKALSIQYDKNVGRTEEIKAGGNNATLNSDFPQGSGILGS